MPSIYAHYLFGQRTFEDLPDAMRKCISRARPHFDLGLQGPDFFYYGSIFRDQTALNFGERMHAESMHETLETILRELHVRNGQERGGLTVEQSSYLMGFIGHFTLDSIVHPYVYRIQGKLENHLALETDFDSYLLRQKGQIPWKFAIDQCCPADPSVIKTVSEIYAPWHGSITPARVAASVRDFHKLRVRMKTPTVPRYRFVAGIMKIFGIYRAYRGMLFPPDTAEHPGGINWPDKPQDAIETMQTLFEEALPQYWENLHDFRMRLEQNTDLPEFFDRNFSMIGVPWKREPRKEE